MASSHFRQLARLITAEDICSPFIATIESNRSASEVSVEWCTEWCDERNVDPMDQIALVVSEGKMQGWVGYDMLDADKPMAECMERISADTILSADTPLIEAVDAFSKSSHPFFLVLKGNHFIGWLSYSDLHRPPLRLCLFAMLINIERLLFDVALLSPQESIETLSEGRLSKAKEIYKLRNHNMDPKGDPYSARLLECTAIADKIHIARKSTTIRQAVSALDDNRFCRQIERLRNEIAHPGLEEKSSIMLKRENIWSFIEWAELLESQLEKLLKQAMTS